MAIQPNFYEQIEKDPYTKYLVKMKLTPIFTDIFSTQTSINSRRETIIEGTTIKAEPYKLIEYKRDVENNDG